MLLGIILTLFLVLLNGFFVATEFALVKVRQSQLELKAKNGNRIAPYTLVIIKQLDAYLSATQLGITLASLGLGWIGEDVTARIISNTLYLFDFSIDPITLHTVAITIAFAIISVMHIVFGELCPKAYAIMYPENTALGATIPIKLFYYIFRPFIWVLNGLANFFLKLMGIKTRDSDDYHSAEELRLLIDKGKDSGAIEFSEHELIQNVFNFNERTVKQIMVPRTKIAAIEIPISNKEVVETVIKEGYSRMPVYNENIDNIIGFINAKDLLAMVKQKEAFVLKDIMREAYFVPETLKIGDLLRDFQRKHVHMAIVLDEFGGTAGMVTLEDVIEEIVGEIQDEYDEEKPIVEKVSVIEFNVNAQAAITDVNELLPYPIPESDDYDTMAGYMNVVFEKIPDVGETTFFGEYEFTILKKNKRSVQMIRLKVLDAKTKGENGELKEEL